MAARPWTDTEDATLRELAGQGVPQREIGRRLDRSPGAVAARAAKLGVRSDRTVTAAATQANILDAKARRARLELTLLEDAERLRAQVWQPHEYIDHGGKEFVEVRWTQDQPTPTDKLKLMQAATIAVRHSLEIGKHDTDTGEEAAVSMAGDILDAVRAAADQLRADKAGEAAA